MQDQPQIATAIFYIFYLTNTFNTNFLFVVADEMISIGKDILHCCNVFMLRYK